MTVSFKQIRPDKDITETEGFITILLSSVLILSIGIYALRTFNLNPFLIGIIMIASAWIGRPLIRKLLPDRIKRGDIIGNIILENETIIWTNNKETVNLHTANICEIDLTYNYILGRQSAYMDIIHNGFAQITIRTKEVQSFTIKFLIEKEEQLDNLKPIWKEFYKDGIKIRERMGKYKVKTILFEEGNLSYEQLQGLKQELNVDNFY